ncbi:MAG: hypothetical protein M3P22_02565 [bacterium]|nr:hypothetical protein [bacterium]
MNKSIIFSVLVVLVFGILFYKLGFGPKSDTENKDVTINPIQLCFAKYGTPNERGSADEYTLRLSIKGTEANGELNMLPAEKDSKVGTFVGTVSVLDQQSISARHADLVWDTRAEGQSAKEQLTIIFGEGTASIGFGEMVQGAGGVYLYKDPTKISYNLDLTDVSCSDLEEREAVIEYLNKNITKLSPTKAVLGGTWYIVSSSVNIQNNSGSVTYEDGHIQEKRNFTYTTSPQNTITQMNFK